MMFVVSKNISLSLFILLMVSSCSSMDVTFEEYAKELNGQCLVLTEPLALFEVRGSDKISVSSFSSSYLMLGSADGPHRFIKKSKMVDGFQKGDSLIVRKIINFPYGSAGSCWVVKVSHQRYKDRLIEIPSCWVWDQPIWVSPSSPATQTAKGGQLHITTDKLKGVSGSTCQTLNL